MTYLLDTSVYSQPLRNKPVIAALEHWSVAGDGRCRLSIVSHAEILFGLHWENNEARWRRYRELLEGRLQTAATDGVVWEKFAACKARQQQLGQPVADLDLLIAATAMVNSFTVATLNRQDFSRIEGVAWEDWNA